MSEFTVPRRDLCTFFIDNGTKSENIQRYLEENYSLSPSKSQQVLESIQKLLLSSFKDRWAKANRTKDKFYKNNSSWVDTEFKVIFNEATTSNSSSTASGERGRPSKSYEDLSDKSRKRKNMELVQEYGFEQVHNAYLQELRSQGESEEASLVTMMRNLSRDEKKTIKEKVFHDSGTVSSFSVYESLSLYIDLDLSKSQYGYLRACLIQKNCNILPSYQILSNAKKMCYPPYSSIEITDTYAKVKLQDLLDHTVARILMIKSVDSPDLRRLKLFTKWGCDGSSGQSEYKQILIGENEFISDANLFICSLVPIKLTNLDTNQVLWQNPTCSSPRYCRPILMEFAKETPEKTRAVVSDIRSQITYKLQK